MGNLNINENLGKIVKKAVRFLKNRKIRAAPLTAAPDICISSELLPLLYPRREAGILWIHHRCRPRPRPRPQRFLVSDLQSTFLSGFLSYLAGGLIW